MLYIYDAPNELTAPLVTKAWRKALPNAQIVTKYHAGDCLGFGSPQTHDMMMRAKAAGFNWYYGDKAYFGRHDYYRFTKNAYQHGGIGEPNFERLRQIGLRARDYRYGRKIVICPQSETHYVMRGTTLDAWMNEVLAAIKQHSDREYVVTSKNRRAGPCLMDKIGDAHCVIVHSSNAAVDAIMQGIPCFTTADCAATAMASGPLANLESPRYPSHEERMHWAAVLAANQWTLDEIARGMAWEAIA